MTKAIVMRSSGLVQRNPTENRIRALVGALSPGDHVVLEQFGSSSSHYIQAWLRPDGYFQLEYRAGNPSEHYQTQTESRDEVASALAAWSKEESAWREDFVWTPIGDLFNNQ